LNLFAAAQEVKQDYLVQFKAGIMNMNPNNKLVTADKRKGLVQLKAEDGLVQFIWKDRLSNRVETDLTIFKDAASFRKVNEAKGRVYVLEFKDTNKKIFFWMQEPSDEKDVQYCSFVNKYINIPPQPGARPGGTGEGGVGNLDQNQLLQFLANSQGSGNMSGLRELLQRGVGGGAGTGGGAQRRPVTTATTGASRATTATSITPPTTSVTTPSGTQTTTRATNSNVTDALKKVIGNVSNIAKEKPEPSLSDVVNVEEILKSGILDNAEIVKKLVEFLPEGTDLTVENLRDNLNSSQFKEAVRHFNQALRSGELASIAMSFGLDASSFGPNSTIEDFLLAIQKSAKQEKEKNEKKETNNTSS